MTTEPARRLQLDFNQQEYLAFMTCAMLGAAMIEDQVHVIMKCTPVATDAYRKLSDNEWNNLIGRLSKGGFAAFPEIEQGISFVTGDKT